MGPIRRARGRRRQRFARHALTPEMRGNNFGPALEAPDAASALERLIAFSGREL